MKYKLKYSNFNKENGLSSIIISTNLGNFEGKCQLHEEDKDIQSEFFGCNIAEARAIIKYLKEKIKLLKSNIKTIKVIISNLENSKEYNKNSIEARTLRKQYFICNDKLKKEKENIENLKQKIYFSINNYRQSRNNFIKKIEEKKSIKEK